MGGANTNNGQTGNQKLYNVATNSSVLGQSLNVVIGTRKTNQLIFWQDGFQANPISKKQAGGKGGGKSGQYNYSADVVAGLCAGPISGIGSAWSGQSFLGNINAAEQFAITSTNFTFTPTNASSAVNNFGVTPSANVSGTFDDFGAPSPTQVSATTSTPFTQVPVGTTPGKGEYSYNPSTGTYTFSPDDAGTTVTAAYSFLLTEINQQETDIIPSTLQIAVSPEFPFQADLGVVFSSTTAANDGVALTRVQGNPTQEGTYSVQGSGPAVYKFAPADEGAQVTITFQISDTGAVSTGESTTLDFTLATGEIGQSPFAFLSGSFPQAALGYTGIATLLFEPMDLGPSAEIQQNSFEVITPDIYGGVYATTNLPILDCNPVQCILRVLTDTQWGLGTGAIPFPTSVIDNGPGGTWGTPGTPSVQQSGSTAFNWFAANSLFISPLLDSQDSASSTIGKWLEACMCAAYVSEGLLKLVPYGDKTVAANGCTWTAPTTFVVALDDTCFLAKEGEDPVQISRSSWQDAWNGVQVTYSARAFQYNSETIEESDQALINRFGSRLEDPQDWDFLCELPAATAAANLRLKRQTYIRNTYKFSLPFNYSYIEPMDIVTITTSSVWAQDLNNENLGISNLPVRITKVVDNPGDDGLQFEAEDYPFGVGQATLFNKGINDSNPQPNTQASPGTAEVVFFEASGRLVQFGPNQIWFGACGTGDNYGGCNVFASQDNEDFVQVAQLKQISVIGELAEAFPVGSDPDTVNSLVVELAENSAGLVSATQQAANNDTTICYVDGEVIAFSTAALTGQNTWTLSEFIRRGQLGTAIAAHAAGGLFMRLDGSIYKYTYDPTANGQQIWFKFQPFNTFGNQATPLSQLQSVSITLSATNSGVIDGSSGLIEQGSVNGLTTTISGINTTLGTLTSSSTSTLALLADMSSVSFLTPSEQIAFIAQFNAMISTQTSLDATASSLGVSSSAYDSAVANISTQLIAAGAPSNFATTWPTMTTFGPADDIQTDLANLFSVVASQQAALQSAISAQQASTAQASAVATAASNALTQINTAVTTLNEQAPIVVTTLPTLPNSSFPVGKYVFDSTNGQLFTVTADNTFQPLLVPTTSLTGTLQAAQINSLAASQVTGQLTAAQIASVNAAQVTGQLTASQIAAVNAASVGAGLVASQIASVEASVVSGSLTEATIPTGQLTGQISAAQIEANSIGTNQLASQSVTTANLVVTSVGSALNADPNCNDITAFTNNTPADGDGGTLSIVTVTDNAAGQVGNTALQLSGLAASVATGPIPLSFGKSYRVTVLARQISGGSDLFFRFFQYPATVPQVLGLPQGFSAFSIGFENQPLSSAWTRFTATVTPASGITWGALAIVANDNATGVAQVQDWRIEEQIPASLVVNGTLTSQQIQAQGIVASSIADSTLTSAQILAGSIQAESIQANSLSSAQIVAGGIVASSIASNTLTSSQIQAGSIVGASIAANTIEASSLVSNSITANQLAANSVSATALQANSVSTAALQAGAVVAGTIAAGAIGATQIAANSISTTNLTVADLTNNVYNPGFESGLASWSSQNPSLSVISTTQAHSGTQSLELLPVSGEFAIINANVVPAVPGQQFISQIFAIATNGTSGSVNLRMYWYTAGEAPNPGGSVNAIDAAPFGIGTSWAQATANFTVPSNAVAVQFAIVAGNISGGDVFLDDAYFRRMTDGSLIVDGSISSASIVSGGITADVLTSGSINASVIDVTNLDASNITVGTLDATQVVFADGSSVNTASRVTTSVSTITSAVAATNSTPVATGLGFTISAESTSEVFNLYTSLTLNAAGGTSQPVTVSVFEDVTSIFTTELFGSPSSFQAAQSFVFSVTGLIGAHKLEIFISLASGATNNVVLLPTASGSFCIGQSIL